MMDVVPVRRALLSVSDKTGLVELARGLAEKGVTLLASGGTREALVQAGLNVIEVASLTGQAEILGGRVKTLHPAIHAGILARRDVPADLSTLQQAGFEPIDLVVVNLYPFERTVSQPGVSLEEAIEQIDIGGPSLIRGAAKNHAHVAVLTSPDQYPGFLEKLRASGGTTLAARRLLALSAFRRTAAYDQAISAFLAEAGFEPEDHAKMDSDLSFAGSFPSRFHFHFKLRDTLRYGENPHQSAAFYVEPNARGRNLATARILHGKELSFNNLLDLDSAVRLIREFREPAACVLKHNNPCGAAEADTLEEAFELAYEGDPVSAFGGVIGLNRAVDRATAERMCAPSRFLECIIAPDFEPEALAFLTTKPSWRQSVRLVSLDGPIGPDQPVAAGFDLRRVEGGLLVQNWDRVRDDASNWRQATQRGPSDQESQALRFAWIVCAAVKSNAIVLARGRQVVGVGAGQMSRLDSVRIAVEKAGQRTRGAVMASDAFFPFRDGPDAAIEAGVTAIIQPGGSKRDSESIAACDERQVAMVLTGQRHFRH
jgi:phosphoribosylaminoimidazolecarboxamide formyltransferase/IMP cyclohydrolase